MCPSLIMVGYLITVDLFQHKSETDRKAQQLHFAIRIGNIDYIKTLLADGVDLYEVNSVSILML